MAEIPEAVAAEAERLFVEGENLADEERDAEALDRFQAAWDMLPEPKTEWERSFALLGALADTHFHLGNWESARRVLRQVIQTWDVLDNPFIRMRMGQCLFELGDRDEAVNWMVPAYLTEGTQLFEDDDPKYLASFKDQLEPPPGGWPEGW